MEIFKCYDHTLLLADPQQWFYISSSTLHFVAEVAIEDIFFNPDYVPLNQDWVCKLQMGSSNFHTLWLLGGAFSEEVVDI